MLVYLLQGLTLGLSATATPGPFQAFLLAQTLKHGWQRTWPAALAPLVSDGPIVFLVLLVLTQTPGWFLNLLQIGGGLFVLYIAGNVFVALRQTTVGPGIAPPVASQNFFQAALMNALSPGPYLFWSVIAGPIVLEGWRQASGLALSFVLGFYGALIGGNMIFVILFATASQLGPLAGRILRVISVVALVVFGLYQIWTGVTSLV